MAGWVEYQRRRIAGEEPDVPWFVGDKLKAYEFAAKHSIRTPARYAVLRSLEEFNPDLAPDYFVCKPTGMHSTEGVMILKREAKGRYHDFLRKRDLTTEQIIAEQQRCYDNNRYKGSFRLILEELLLAEDSRQGVVPWDYKLYCFGGRVELITQIDRNVGPPAMAWFGPDFTDFDPDAHLESDWKLIQRGTPRRPDCWREMLGAARQIANALKTPFTSVDLFATPWGPVLGEITLAPGGPYYGKMYRFKPDYDAELGACWEAAERRLRGGLPATAGTG
ncbi:hypothetical protein LGR54_17225 [Ancylobacter sp. Lp-2]|uniref:ATP-grasp fold amidoligase family protein n=1 Tax=Ancylobacter sp. Lp-2 TaxID=2881339 RepID=UPI001E48F9E6|nr:ATP-grasp fold amidoligase family protein [Ancylobacter sp. Lp-2]MCB4770352.1 hypothetical protein [Ancylobacter sp. Lp-2]